MRAVELEALRQGSLTEITRLPPWDIGQEVLVIDTVLIPLDGLSVSLCICPREMTFHTIGIIEREGAVELQIVGGIAETTIAVCVPQDTIVAVAHHKRHRHLRVVLIEILIPALHIQFVGLVLSKPIIALRAVVVEL